MAQSSEATRSSVVEASAREQTFFKKLSGGFSAVQDSVASLEELTEEVSSNLGILDTPKSAKKEKKQKQTTITSNDAFFAPESAILANFTSVYEETAKLHETLATCPVNIDPLEGRLLALRERLLKLEEKPRLLKGGYKPYIPPKSPAEQLASYEGDKVATETPYKLFPTTTEAVKKSGTQVGNEKSVVKQANMSTTPLLKSISSPVEFVNIENSSSNIPILTSSSSSISAKISSSESSVSKPVVVDAKIAKCLSILDRWNSVSSDDVPKAADEAFAASSIPRNITFVKPKTPDLGCLSSLAKVDNHRPQTSTCNTFCSNTPKPPGSAFKPNVNINRSKTFTLNSNTLPNLETTPANAENSIEFDEVEFTPGMFSRVPKKR